MEKRSLMKIAKSLTLSFLLAHITTVQLLGCIDDSRIDSPKRWETPLDVLLSSPQYRLRVDQILVLHLPLTQGKSFWNIPKSGKNEHYRWYTEATSVDQELRILALSEGKYDFPLPFINNNETSTAMLRIDITPPVTYSDLVTLKDDGRTIETDMRHTIIVKLDLNSTKKGKWTLKNKNLTPKKVDMYKDVSSEGMMFTFDSSSEKRELVFEYIEDDGWNWFPRRVKFYFDPSRPVPTC